MLVSSIGLLSRRRRAPRLFSLERHRYLWFAAFAHAKPRQPIGAAGQRGVTSVPNKSAAVGRGGGTYNALVVVAPIEGDQGLAGKDELNAIALVPATGPSPVPAGPG